jgi:hypothetical protein
MVLILSLMATLIPTEQTIADQPHTFFPDAQWGGHLRAIGIIAWPDDETLQAQQDEGPYWDGQEELRLKNELLVGKRFRLETHYELVAQHGDTTEVRNKLGRTLPQSTLDQLVGRTINDERRLMNLTHIIDDGDRHVLSHRLDRLNLTYTDRWGTLCIGRQALTWGNGLVFNPMDLFNPFAPTTVLRDHKAGDDMAHLQLPLGNGEAQFLVLPRRDPDTGKVEQDQSSYASKWRFPAASIEVDFMAARHYRDNLLGIGATGYLGGAAWRMDTIYTLLDMDEEKFGFWQFVANLDYAWQWGGQNIYGLLEFFFNEQGYTDSYDQALSDPVLSQRLVRGELFTLGTYYLAGQCQIELHPLVQSHLTTIVNLSDLSLIVQPQLIWDASASCQLIAGANIHTGAEDTEYGGFDVNVGLSSAKVVPNDSAFVWLTYYF